MRSFKMRDGVLIVNKPSGMTSHDVVDFVRKSLKVRRIGHSGTLDPIATGVLLILVGKATKLFNRFLGFDKEYVATLTLGARTNSGDISGRVIETKDYKEVTKEKINEAFTRFTGRVFQVPPMFSALKHKGKRLYFLARRGIEIERPARTIIVKELKLLDFNLPQIKFYLKCSRGTYVRKIAEDIAYSLGTLGCISWIERQAIGPFNIKEAISLDEIDQKYIKPIPEEF